MPGAGPGSFFTPISNWSGSPHRTALRDRLASRPARSDNLRSERGGLALIVDPTDDGRIASLALLDVEGDKILALDKLEAD
jgi:hypothetical protein